MKMLSSKLQVCSTDFCTLDALTVMAEHIESTALLHPRLRNSAKQSVSGQQHTPGL